MTATNRGERHLELWVEGSVDAQTGFVRDSAAMAQAARTGVAVARLWRRSEPALALGRFQRRALGASGLLERRLTGGRYVPLGPAVLGLTLVFPELSWLSASPPGLRPDQVLNRALRPLLGSLRDLGVDAFYPGRDLLTVSGRPFGHAAFTMASDGVTLVEVQLALDGSWREAGELLAVLDPDGVAGADAGSWAQAVGLGELSAGVPEVGELESWTLHLEESAAREFAATVGVETAGATPWSSAIYASEEAWKAFQSERGPAPEGALQSVSMAMLGLVEASARLDGDRLRDVCIAGELMAPHHTLEDLQEILEGEVFRGPQIRKALVKILGRPRNFVLGINDLDALLERLT